MNLTWKNFWVKSLMFLIALCICVATYMAVKPLIRLFSFPAHPSEAQLKAMAREAFPIIAAIDTYNSEKSGNPGISELKGMLEGSESLILPSEMHSESEAVRIFLKSSGSIWTYQLIRDSNNNESTEFYLMRNLERDREKRVVYHRSKSGSTWRFEDTAGRDYHVIQP